MAIARQTTNGIRARREKSVVTWQFVALVLIDCRRERVVCTRDGRVRSSVPLCQTVFDEWLSLIRGLTSPGRTRLMCLYNPANALSLALIRGRAW